MTTNAMFNLSATIYQIEVFQDQDATIPMPLTGLTLIGTLKKRIADSDASALAMYEIGNGLEIDGDDSHIVYLTISSADTSSLPRTRPTTVYFELLTLTPERQTLGQMDVPVKATLLDDIEGS